MSPATRRPGGPGSFSTTPRSVPSQLAPLLARLLPPLLLLAAAPAPARGAVIAYYADAACATSTSKVLAFTDVCLPEAGQQVAVVLTACSASALAGSLFAAPSMAAAPTCTGNAQVFAASAACTQVGTTGVYTKALDFTCASGGAAYVYALDTASSSCASTSNAALVRYVPVLAGSACNAGGPAASDALVTASGSSVALTFYSSTGGTCTTSGASFADVPTTGTCTAVAGGGASSIKVWAATCAMTLFAGYDVVGTRISTAMQATETACAASCCAAAGCVAYSFGQGLLSVAITVPAQTINSHSDPYPTGDHYTTYYTTGPFVATNAITYAVPCTLLANVSSLVPSSLFTGGIIPAFLAKG
jgi:hypothetical protein